MKLHSRLRICFFLFSILIPLIFCIGSIPVFCRTGHRSAKTLCVPACKTKDSLIDKLYKKHLFSAIIFCIDLAV